MTTSSLPAPAATLPARRIIAGIGLVSLALIAGAWYFELVVGLLPCKLCLEQRWPHYAAIATAALGLALARTVNQRKMVLILLAGLMLWSVGLGVYHSGVEWGWFAGPNDCGGRAAPMATGVGDLMRQLETVRVVSCTQAAWRLLGLSLAGWNALASLALLAAALVGLKRAR